jgi:hypothetical protein
MHLVQILLPVTDNEGRGFPPDLFATVREALTERFGGLTAFTRAPAEGLWKSHPEKTSRDDIVVLEVMAEAIDREWWAAYRQELETGFRQQEIVIRVQDIELL